MKFVDERGYFVPVKLDISPVQANVSFSHKGVIRGMHQQFDYNQSKQLFVLQGIINDVWLDPYRGKVESFVLKEGDSLLVPRNYFHGFEVLSKGAKLLYFVDNKYSPSSEVSINPLSFGYKWRTKNPIISDKDRKGLTIDDFVRSNERFLL